MNNTKQQRKCWGVFRKNLNIRVTERQFRLWQAAADRANTELSTWVREVLDKEAKR